MLRFRGHIAGVQALLGASQQEAEATPPKEDRGLPTLAQFKLSRELAGESCSAQGAEPFGLQESVNSTVRV